MATHTTREKTRIERELGELKRMVIQAYQMKNDETLSEVGKEYWESEYIKNKRELAKKIELVY